MNNETTLGIWSIIGSRDLALPVEAIGQAVRRVWYAFDVPVVDIVVTGDARGADRLAARWAERVSVPCSVFRAHWDTEGRRAGVLRTARMFKKARPSVVVAITNDEKISRGTRHSMRMAYEMGLPMVWFVVGDGPRLRMRRQWGLDERLSEEALADAMVSPEEVR